MRRLYLHIYLTLVATLILFGLLNIVVWWLRPANTERLRILDSVGTVLNDLLPPADRPLAELDADPCAARTNHWLALVDHLRIKVEDN